MGTSDQTRSQQAIEQFFSVQAYAVVGVSRDPRKFGAVVFREMNNRHLLVYPVTPHTPTIDGVRCFASVKELPDEVQSAAIVVHPEDAEKIVRECHQKGIRNIWLQKGAESEESLAFAREHGMNIIFGLCILMFLDPVTSLHSLHRWVKKMFGTFPSMN
jgi:predicted CoA-binding protein